MPTAPDAIEQSLSFNVGGQTFSLPAGAVVEVIRPRACTRVPNTPASLRGLSNFRGAALPVISLSVLLGRGDTTIAPSSRVIVVDQGQTVGLLVDAIASLAEAESSPTLKLSALLSKEFDGLSRRSTRARSNAVPSAAQPTAPPESSVQLLCFGVAGQEFAFPAIDVEAVSSLPFGVTEVPGADDAMLGVIELRGAIIPLVSLSALLGLRRENAPKDTARVIVTRIGTHLVGLVSDDVRAVLQVPLSSVDAVPTVLTRGAGEAQIQSICRLQNGRLVPVLARDHLFDPATSACIAKAGSAGAELVKNVSSLQSLDEKFLIFHLGGETYGLPIAAVDRIVRRPEKLSRVPRAPDFIQGAMNIDGKMVPIIDQGLRFAVARAEETETSKIIVLTVDGQKIGIVVHRVSEIIAVHASELKNAPVYEGDAASVVARVAMLERDGRVILILDPRALLDSAQRDILTKLAEEAMSET